VPSVEVKEVRERNEVLFFGWSPGHQVANDATDPRGLVFVFYETGDAYGTESSVLDRPRCTWSKER
jgi:hypothetical protein